MSKVIIIAEAGVNHNGDLELAKRLIEEAAKAGADYVKFQTFKTESLVSKNAQQANYQTENSGKEESQFEMLKRLELKEEEHQVLKDYCNLQGIKFLSTAFDHQSIDFLDQLGIDLFKIPSGEVTNAPYIKHIAAKGKQVVMSTGMCDLKDIEAAYNILQEQLDKKDITILHCNTAYPTQMGDVNLKAMTSIQNAFDVNIGYSDHTLGIEVSIAAVSLGATVIEKHFTLDKTLPGPDHKASLEPKELRDLVSAIRNIEKALGDGVKAPSSSEKLNISAARRSIHTKQALKSGTVLQEEHLEMLRPGDGISPMDMQQILGKSVKEDLPIHHKFDWSDLE